MSLSRGCECLFFFFFLFIFHKSFFLFLIVFSRKVTICIMTASIPCVSDKMAKFAFQKTEISLLNTIFPARSLFLKKSIVFDICIEELKGTSDIARAVGFYFERIG